MTLSVLPIDSIYFTSTPFPDFRVHHNLSNLLSGEVQ